MISTYNETQNVDLPVVTWASNQFRLITDDEGIGILCTREALHIDKLAGENCENFFFGLFSGIEKCMLITLKFFRMCFNYKEF